MAVSARQSSFLWLVNDSGNAPHLIGLDLDSGAIHPRPLIDVQNVDWEDLAAFSVKGEPWIAIADIGDNGARRERISVHFLPEPVPLESSPLAIHATLSLRYPDGPRDAESLAIDSATGTVYVLSKRETRPRLYRTRLPSLRLESPATPAREERDLEYLGEVSSIPPPSRRERSSFPFGRYRAQPTALATHPKSNLVALLTYRGAYLARLDEDRDWLRALNTTLCPLKTPELKQGETIAVEDENVYVSSEGRRAPVFRLPATCATPAEP